MIDLDGGGLGEREMGEADDTWRRGIDLKWIFEKKKAADEGCEGRARVAFAREIIV